MSIEEILNTAPTPCYVIDEKKLIENLETLQDVASKSGCKILLAQKAYSAFCTYPLISKYISGTTASGLYEAKLGYEEMGKENHIFSAVYSENEVDEIVSICDHIIFNSFNQWNKYKSKCLKSNKSCGIRINPQYSTQEHGIYDPCSKFSRLGVTLENFENQDLTGIDGLHFHTLCEQNAQPLAETLKVVEQKFGKYLYNMKWLNMGGGHHITRDDYDRNLLIDLIKNIKEKYNIEVYLEPGEAVALNAGYLVATVEDIVFNEMNIAILNTSPACHMPDVIEMPYRPNVINGYKPFGKEYTYRFGGPTCLAGDIIGDYSFENPLNIGDKIIFLDMAIYSMVKNNTFNGMKLPSIMLLKKDGELKKIKEFGYLDFKERLS